MLSKLWCDKVVCSTDLEQEDNSALTVQSSRAELLYIISGIFDKFKSNPVTLLCKVRLELLQT
jgi:hypothetical protein